MELQRPNERIDDLQRSGLKILQDPERFCFGMDAVLLSYYAKAKKNERVMDLCTGTGILPLLLSAKTEAGEFYGLEIQADSADMARRSVEMNDLTEKIHIVTGDYRDAVKEFGASSFDVVTCNPPYMKASHGIQNPEDAKSIARHEIHGSYVDLIEVIAKLLKQNGRLYMVHRPHRLVDLMYEMRRFGLEPKRMQMVYPYANKEPNMVLLECVRGGRPELKVDPPLIVYKEPGVYTDEILEIYGY